MGEVKHMDEHERAELLHGGRNLYKMPLGELQLLMAKAEEHVLSYPPDDKGELGYIIQDGLRYRHQIFVDRLYKARETLTFECAVSNHSGCDMHNTRGFDYGKSRWEYDVCKCGCHAEQETR
jgi:hypothetical protein